MSSLSSKTLKHPDSSYVIVGYNSFYGFRVGVYDVDSNSLVETCGYIKPSEVVGYTMTSFDWAKYIKSRENCVEIVPLEDESE